MSGEVLVLALVVGAANWAFRYLPIRFGLGSGGGAGGGDGVLARFLAAVGPAAIATLFVASSLPFVQAGAVAAPLAGTAGVVAVWVWRRSVVLATLAGAVAYAAGFALAG
ncbi:AzlD domain-containing protein [Rhodobacteraceae bacterium HSP-20]|uniref:AzlD domain-containing protein n=1 Tax=Paragemmobacter amnigenus TaxID=2852097 RepID=A0ABS6J1C6_9RHOB|nr:AzlD domain-containing protein [Rhodobacter amnigenus]MBU9697543.1 AzlD domain-containing protein [Rhodobacter amnigenus]MBV4388770.1 AzlD domain-containing protein [Rhodobacter amnigenus]